MNASKTMVESVVGTCLLMGIGVSVGACGAQQRRAVLAVADATCIVAQQTSDAEAIRVACRLEQALVPIIRDLISARRIGAARCPPP